mmetsp:Transcript_6939/g.21111  ORF Transcript_6939/g.21111 Transcript_6939/m.21111 type:complete len:175 (-) Transcript_6939:1170-1694(-)
MVAKLGNYVLKETLGKGSYSEVKLAVHEITGEEFAIKVMGRQALQSKHFEEEVKNEIRALQAAKHPNVVNIRKVLLSNKSVYIVMEIVRGGELFDRIVGAGRLAPPVARRYFQQIVDAVFYCHLQVRLKGTGHNEHDTLLAHLLSNNNLFMAPTSLASAGSMSSRLEARKHPPR